MLGAIFLWYLVGYFIAYIAERRMAEYYGVKSNWIIVAVAAVFGPFNITAWLQESIRKGGK